MFSNAFYQKVDVSVESGRSLPDETGNFLCPHKKDNRLHTAIAEGFVYLREAIFSS